jgi:membrane-bound lytic murein transglycosylase MltF
MHRKKLSLVFLIISLLRPAMALDTASLMQRPLFQEKRSFDKMKADRVIRVLTTHNMVNFFVDKGQPRGFEYELLSKYEDFLNQGITRKELKILVVLIPVSFRDLIPALNQGFGDIVAAGFTVTDARRQQVLFSHPYIRNVSEIVVTGPSAPELNTLESLSGHKIYLRRGTSYDQHLQILNQAWQKRGLTPVDAYYLPDALETEDILRMVHAGILDTTIADRHVAELWATVLPNLKLHSNLALHTGGQIAWAVRHDNPALLASINTFMKDHRQGTLLGNIFFKRYFKNEKWVSDPASGPEREKIRTLRVYFEKYSAQYSFDWLLMGAQGFQESRLDQNIRSPAGAIGIMQLMPSTAADMGISDIHLAENNVHAGIKYMDYLRRKFFNEPDIPPAVKVDFTLAAYNAGPNRVNRWRKKAKQQGLDPNRWFSHVEWISLQEIGPETMRYVANINMIYLGYRLMFDRQQVRQDLLQKVDGDSRSQN